MLVSQLSIAILIIVKNSYHLTDSLEIKQVSFEDSAAQSGTDNVDSRDAKIFESSENGDVCFVYSTEAKHGDDSTSFADWKIWQTCGVFEDSLTNTLLAGDKTSSSTDHTFADTSGDGGKVCYIEDLAGSGKASMHLLSTLTNDVVALTNSSASDGKRNSRRCDVSRDGSTVVFESDDDTLVPTTPSQLDGQEHVFITHDEGSSFHRAVPNEYWNAEKENESTWGVVSGDGTNVAFHAKIPYPGASSIAWETYLTRESDSAISKITSLSGKECNRTLMHSLLVDMWGMDNLTKENLATEAKLGNGQTQCSSFAAMGVLPDGAGTIGVKDNAASISDDARFVTFMAGFKEATLKGTYEQESVVSVRNLFLYDTKLGITWAVTHEGPYEEKKVENFCCPYASSSYKRESCSTKNQYRLGCCWQRPCGHPVVTNRISGDGTSIVYAGDRFPDPAYVNYDWEITHYYIPTGSVTIITNTTNKDYDDFYPSISRKGDVMAWTSDFDYATDSSITSNNQIFAAKLVMGCSRRTTASNYISSPDVETCCEWDGSVNALGSQKKVQISFMGDPAEMKSHIAFYSGTASEDEIFCTTYAEQVRTDVACSLAVPKELVTVCDDLDCHSWSKDSIHVKLNIMSSNEYGSATSLSDALKDLYEDTNSILWRSYLTKTMKPSSLIISPKKTKKTKKNKPPTTKATKKTKRTKSPTTKKTKNTKAKKKTKRT